MRLQRALRGCCASSSAALVVVAGLLNAAAAQAVLHQWSGISQPPFPWHDNFGWSIAGIGDANGDRVPDVAVGADSTTVGTLAQAGRLYVFSGADGSTIFTLDGTVASEFLGFRVESAGDVDGDGRADILAWSDVSPGAGDFQLVSGRTGAIIATYPDYISAAGVGDVDDDGRDDLLFGRYHLVPAVPGPGMVSGPGIAHVISGRTGSIVHAFSGTYQQQNFGWLVDSAGDVNGDGVEDLLIGAVGEYPWTGGFGVWVFSGASGFLLYHKPAVGPTDSFPYAIAGVGDLDADGLDDIAVTDHGIRVWNNYSAIWTFGGPSGAPLMSLPGGTQIIGHAVAGPGDVDGDGFDDILQRGAGPVTGIAELYSGRTQAVLVSLIAAGPVEEVGDVNGDDFPDYLVGGFASINGLAEVRLYSGAPIGVTTLGQGCANALGIVPRIGCTDVPARGSQFELHVTRARVGAQAILALGTSTTAWSTVPLPLDLASLNMPNCFLRVAVDSTALASTVGNASKGRASHALQIPNLPALAGMTFHAQWLVLEPAGAPALASTTRALSVTIQ